VSNFSVAFRFQRPAIRDTFPVAPGHLMCVSSSGANERDGGDGMRGKKSIVGLMVLAMLMVAAIRPPRAEAKFDTTPLIISASVAGGLALIAFIAILLSSDDDEPDFLAEPSRRRAPGDRRFHVGFPATRHCPVVGGNLSIACW
jgi:hypothetical protein